MSCGACKRTRTRLQSRLRVWKTAIVPGGLGFLQKSRSPGVGLRAPATPPLGLSASTSPSPQGQLRGASGRSSLGPLKAWAWSGALGPRRLRMLASDAPAARSSVRSLLPGLRPSLHRIPLPTPCPSPPGGHCALPGLRPSSGRLQKPGLHLLLRLYYPPRTPRSLEVHRGPDRSRPFAKPFFANAKHLLLVESGSQSFKRGLLLRLLGSPV